MGQQAQVHQKKLGKPLKFLRTKLNILKLCQNKFENPHILKQYPHIICPM
jgi:hypothetical protein